MLSIEASCDIVDFISEVEKKSGKNYSEVEHILFDESIYPEGESHLIDKETSKTDWLQKAITDILEELGIKDLLLVER